MRHVPRSSRNGPRLSSAGRGSSRRSLSLSLSIVHMTAKLSELTRVEVLKVGSRLEIVHRPATSGESQTHRRSVIIAGATCCQAAAAAAEPVRRHALESAMSVLLSQHLGGSNRQEVALQPQHSPRAQNQRYTALCRNLCTAVTTRARERYACAPLRRDSS